MGSWYKNSQYLYLVTVAWYENLQYYICHFLRLSPMQPHWSKGNQKRFLYFLCYLCWVPSNILYFHSLLGQYRYRQWRRCRGHALRNGDEETGAKKFGRLTALHLRRSQWRRAELESVGQVGRQLRGRLSLGPEQHRAGAGGRWSHHQSDDPGWDQCRAYGDGLCGDDRVWDQLTRQCQHR